MPHDLSWLLEHLEGVEGSGTQYSAYCPCHDDIGTEWKGLSITLMGDKILCKCHSCGATLPAVEKALENGGYDVEDIPLTIRSHSGKKGMAWWIEKTGVPGDIWAEMDCVEEGSGVAFLFDIDLRKIRKPPKDIIWQPAGVECPPLWPTIEDELPDHIWITEGESDAGTARAAGHNAYAVTKGSKTAMPRGWVDALKARGVKEITVCGDIDEPGMEFTTSLIRDVMDAGLTANRVRLELIIDPFSGLNDLNGVYRVCETIEEFNGAIERATQRTEMRMPLVLPSQSSTIARKEMVWVLPGLIGPSDKVLISGPQKSYKSFLCLDLVRSLTTCSPFLMRDEWTPSRPHTTLYVQEEGSPQLWFQRVDKCHLTDADPAMFLHRYGIRFTEPDTLADLSAVVRERGIEVLILDPLQRMIPGIDENDSSATGIVWDEVFRLQYANPGLVVILVHHANKTDTLSWESVRGSSRHAGEVDLGIFTQKNDTGMQIAVDGRDIPQYLGTGEAFDSRVEITDDSFVIDAREVRIVTSKKKIQGQVNRDKVLSTISEGNNTRTTIMRATGLSDVAVRDHLEALIEKDVIEETKQGKGKPNLYTLKESDADSAADSDGD